MTVLYRDLWSVFGRIGLMSFGGPAAQIGLMHRELVEGRGWLSDKAFADALGFCMLLPGPEAMQLATYCGWRLRGLGGGLLAGLLFVAPGALLIAALALVYGALGQTPGAAAALLGIQAAVIAIVLGALIGLTRRALKGPLQITVAACSFAAIWFGDLPFPLLVLAAGLFGAARRPPATGTPPPWPRPAPWRTALIWAALWAAPLPVLWLAGPPLLWDLALFFGTLAVVTFGGAYAVLAYMAQQVVDHHAWLSAAQMVDALGLAETTPGPLILVTQFVGMTAGFGLGGAGLAIVAGLVTLWMTFVPCFLWIFAGAPYIDALSARPRLRAGLDMIAAAVVGVIVNLSIWFAIHVLFQVVTQISAGPFGFAWPVLRSLDPMAVGLTALALGLGFGLRWSPLRLVPAMAIAGLLASGLAGWA